MKLSYRVRREFETATGVLRIGEILDTDTVLSWPNHKSLEAARFITLAADESTPVEQTSAKGRGKK